MVSGTSRLAILGVVSAFLFLAAACSQENADEHFRKGNDYLSQSLPKEAIVEFRTALQVDPGRGDVRLKLADTFMLVSDTAAALKEYVRAADQLPNDSSAQLKAGALLLMGIALGAIHLSFADGTRATRARKAIGVLSSVAGLFLLVSWLEAPRGALSWEPSEDVGRARGQRAEGVPL